MATAAFFAGLIAIVAVQAASAAGTSAGTATVTQTDGLTPLTGAHGSQDPFTLHLLPTPAACTHDTANFSYHIYSYLVPAATDPSTLTFGSTGPTPGFTLVDHTGTPYIAVNTAPNTGVVPQPPQLDMNSFSIDGRTDQFGGPTKTVAAGTYNIGVACATNLGAGDRFWNAQVTFTASTTDFNGETWTVAAATPPPTTTTTTSTTIAGITTTTTTTVGSGGSTTTTTSTTGGGNGSPTSSTSGSSSGTNTGASSGRLAASGGSVLALSDWGLVLIVVGCGAALLSGYRRDEDNRP